MSRLDLARRRALLSIFVVSGFTGLIYESVWSHYLKLFLGHAAYAQTLVLAIFMGGLALGSWIVARYSGRIAKLLWGYVLVEGLIGILGLFFHRVFVAASDFSFSTAIPLLPAGFPIQFYKWTLAALLILPQSALLGMTFPLISGGLIRRWPARPGETVSILYFTNSLGAAIGVLVSGFVLIGMVGLPGTIMTAGVLNVLLALMVWSVVRKASEPAPAPATASPRAEDPLARWFLLAAFLTGAAAFMYELGWIRMLSLVLGSSTHSFELMLSAFIFGLAFGGLHVRKRIERIRHPEIYVGCIMVAMGSLAALTLPLYNAMFDVMAWALRTFTRTEGGYVAFNLVSQSIALLIMVPTTFCGGMTLPLLTYALMRRGRSEAAIGTIYSLNTLGAIVGVLLTVHLIMPLIGVKGVILAGAGIHIALGLSRLIITRGLRFWPAGVALAVSVAAFGSAITIVKLDPARMASGVFRTGLATLPRDATVEYLRDGKTATISLVQHAGNVLIATNGKTDAALQMGTGAPTPDETTTVLAAAIPLSMHPNAMRVANIGFGSGLTTHSLLASTSLRRLDSVEIEPLMVEAARKGFGSRIHDVFEDPRSHIIYEDAKTFFASSHERYDLIVSEPSNPWVSGVASLFSDEFYERIVNYLNADGYFAQWLQVYETDTGIVASIIKALAPHFGSYAIYNLNDSDILIVASRGAKIGVPQDHIFDWPLMRAGLERIGVRSVADVRLRKIGDDRTLGVLLKARSTPPNSDYFPFVDLNAARLRYLQASATELPELTFLPIPFLELLTGSALTALTLEPASQSALIRDDRVRRALTIRRAVASGKLGELDAADASALLLLEMSAQTCSESGTQMLWRGAARRISDATTAYLSPPELGEMWSTLRSGPCYREVANDNRAWVDLFAAISERDASKIVSLSTSLLAPSSPKSKEELAYLTTVTGAAYLQMGQVVEAGRLLEAQASYLKNSGQYALPLQELWALTRASRTARPGDDRPVNAHTP
jgi:spermidine synthase